MTFCDILNAKTSFRFKSVFPSVTSYITNFINRFRSKHLTLLNLIYSTFCERSKRLVNRIKITWSDYFEVLKSWPHGRVAANKILANCDHGSVAAWLQPLKTLTYVTPNNCPNNPLMTPLKALKELISIFLFFYFKTNLGLYL